MNFSSYFLAEAGFQTAITDGMDTAETAGSAILTVGVSLLVSWLVYKFVKRFASSASGENFSSKSETFSQRGQGVFHGEQRFRPGFGGLNRGGGSRFGPSIRGKGKFGLLVAGLCLAASGNASALELIDHEPTYQWAVRSGLQTANNAGESVLAFGAVIVVTMIVWFIIVKFANYCGPEARKERAAFRKEMDWREYSRAERLDKPVSFDLWTRVRGSWDDEDED